MYEFWYDYVKPENDEKTKLCYMDTDTVYLKADDIYKDITKDDETRFDTSNYELDRLLPKGKSKKNNWINEISIRWKNHENIIGLRAQASKYILLKR